MTMSASVEQGNSCPRSENREKLDLYWSELSYSVDVPVKQENDILQNIFRKPDFAEKTVLNNLSGEVNHGQVVAILGPSGAGKSSLLNVLAGRISGGRPSGTITISGKRRGADWNRVAAYVEQADVMYPMLTVRETVAFSAMLRLPSEYSKKQKMTCVDDVIRVLGLQHIADTRIGDAEHRGVSGGEKKRVSIGIQKVYNFNYFML